LRFGIDEERAMTLGEVGAEFHVTRERIRQIEARALRRLRLSKCSVNLKEYID
jgi:RNA polymerase primary sigma factor